MTKTVDIYTQIHSTANFGNRFDAIGTKAAFLDTVLTGLLASGTLKLNPVTYDTQWVVKNIHNLLHSFGNSGLANCLGSNHLSATIRKTVVEINSLLEDKSKSFYFPPIALGAMVASKNAGSYPTYTGELQLNSVEFKQSLECDDTLDLIVPDFDFSFRTSAKDRVFRKRLESLSKDQYEKGMATNRQMVVSMPDIQIGIKRNQFARDSNSFIIHVTQL